nr:MAG TPA: hypothetical protein [Caudoviricetes sp.]
MPVSLPSWTGTGVMLMYILTIFWFRMEETTT